MSTLLKIAEEAKSKNTSKEETLYQQFQTLRLQQRQIATKLTDYEIEENELKIVTKALTEVEPSRKCFRLIGGILYEKTVKDVLPALETRKKELDSFMDELRKQLTDKTNEIDKFKETNSIKFNQFDPAQLKAKKIMENQPQSGTSQKNI